jgi:hypothetical protein
VISVLDILDLALMPEEEYIELARKRSNFDKKPSLHPERKGKLNRSKLKNWVEKHGGLPTYINSIATALLRTNPSWTISRVIATAVNMVKRMCAGGSTAIVKKVGAAVKAAACKALASWNAKKAAASEEVDSHTIELVGVEKESPLPIQVRNLIREQNKEVPEDLEVTDRETLEYIGLELSDDEWEGVNELDMEEYLDIANSAASEIAVAWFPVLDMSEPEKISDEVYEKEIVRAGTITDKKSGQSITFDARFLKEFVQNFQNVVASDGYLPVQDVTDNNEHTDRTKFQVGVVNEMKLDDPDNPTKVIARIKLNDDMRKVVDFNPKVGVSIGASYTHLEEGRPTNVFPRHVAITHRAKLKGMDSWKRMVKASDAGEELTLDLTDADFVERKVNDMAEDTKTPEVKEFNLSELLENEDFKTFLATQIETATTAKDEEIERLRNSVGEVQRSSYEQAVNLAVESYAQAGVPRAVREPAKALLLSFESGEESKELELTEGEGDEAQTSKLSRWQTVTKLLDEVKGVIDMSENGSSEEPEDESDFTGDKRQAAVDGLVNLARLNR